MKPVSSNTWDSDFYCMLMIADRWKFKDAAKAGILLTSRGSGMSPREILNFIALLPTLFKGHQIWSSSWSGIRKNSTKNNTNKIVVKSLFSYPLFWQSSRKKYLGSTYGLWNFKTGVWCFGRLYFSKERYYINLAKQFVEKNLLHILAVTFHSSAFPIFLGHNPNSASQEVGNSDCLREEELSGQEKGDLILP